LRFWIAAVFKRLEQTGWSYSIRVRLRKPVSRAVETIGANASRPLADNSQDSEARIAQTTCGERPVIVRRPRLLGRRALFPDWRCFCFITSRSEGLAVVEAEHRERCESAG
jgi:hypothetical protein